MGFFDGLREAIGPHMDRASSEFAFHMAALHTKLASIERATLDAARGDIGDHWQRFQVKRKFASGEDFELGAVPMNEVWLMQAIASDGVQEKSPPFVVLANQILLESVIKEGLGFEGIGGNTVIMRGEKLSITAREAGNINCVITIIRRLLPVPAIIPEYGRSPEQFSARNTHEISRDAIAQRLGQSYTEPSPETVPSEGRTG